MRIIQIGFRQKEPLTFTGWRLDHENTLTSRARLKNLININTMKKSK